MQRQAWMIETHFRMRLDKADVFFPERPSVPTMIQVTITPTADAEAMQAQDWSVCGLLMRMAQRKEQKRFLKNLDDNFPGHFTSDSAEDCLNRYYDKVREAITEDLPDVKP